MAGHIILFKDANFQGLHKHVFDQEENLSASEDHDFNDVVSSMVILSGNWTFFRDAAFVNPYSVVLGPGLYRFVGQFKIENDDMSSLRTVADPPTMPGDPLVAHAILFEHAHFHGDHRHVFTEEPNLPDNDFNDVTSSIVIEQGNWSFFRNSGFVNDYGPVLGPGIYPSVTDVGINNDDLSSLLPTDAAATVSNSVDNEVLLFVHASFRGPHKHVFTAEPNLNASDDNSFNDAVSSLVVLQGNWSFFLDSDFVNQFPPTLGPGTYSFVGNQNIVNDTLSSLRPAVVSPVFPGSIILFKDANFHGPHKHVFNSEVNLASEEDSDFNDNVSSFAILSGNWKFFRDEGFLTPYPVVLGPGLYSFVGRFQIENDDMSSLTTVSDPPTMVGDPLLGHAVLFEHANFHGDHRHVFTQEPNLPGNDFNDVTSSIVIEQGNWSFFRNSGFVNDYGPVLGPGIYPSVTDVGINNDDLSSLLPTDAEATVSNAVDNEVLVFVHGNLRGAHKHVFSAEPNLNASDDDSFNDAVSSLVVLQGTWSFYADANFVTPYLDALGPGLYAAASDKGISNDDVSSLRPIVATTVAAGDAVVGHVILFEHSGFRGRHRHVFNREENLNASDDSDFNDLVSSMVVLSGNWTFFKDAGFQNPYPVVLGPGLYSFVGQFKIENDDMSSLMTVPDRPTMTGDPLVAHAILFEHAHFHGDHRHVFTEEPNLPNNDFNDVTSSIVVEQGNWSFFRNSGFDNDSGAVLGPGIYPSVTDVGIDNDDLSSLRPTNAEATLSNSVDNEVLLFVNASFRGPHKHVFSPETNLNASDDGSFNDAVSSIAVLRNQWRTYRDAAFQRRYDVILDGGPSGSLFPLVSDVGITNDDLSSLSPAGTAILFKGTAKITVDEPRLPDPLLVDTSFEMLFLLDEDRLLRIETFPDIVPNSLVTVSYRGKSEGVFPSDGALELHDLTFNVAIHIPLASDSTATFSLSTGIVTSPQGKFTVPGSPADAAGHIVLVGVGTMAGGSLGGEDFSVSLTGTIAPRPA